MPYQTLFYLKKDMKLRWKYFHIQEKKEYQFNGIIKTVMLSFNYS